MKLTAETTVFDESAVQNKFSELVVDQDGIRTEVGKKVGGDEVISKINQSAEAIQIEASKVAIEADNYVTAYGGDGVKIHPKNDNDNYYLMSPDGAEIFKGGVSVAQYGNTARVGAVTVNNSANNNLLVNTNGIVGRIGEDTIATISLEKNGGEISAVLQAGVKSRTDSAWVHCAKSSMGYAAGIHSIFNGAHGAQITVYSDSNKGYVSIDADDINFNGKSITSTITETPATGVTLYKTGNLVTINLLIPSKSYSTGWNDICSIPTGYRPVAERMHFVGLDYGTTDLAKVPCVIRIANDGTLQFYKYSGNNASVQLYGTFTYNVGA